jgi:hypothetical protein
MRASTSSRPGKTKGSPCAAMTAIVALVPGPASKRPRKPWSDTSIRPASHAHTAIAVFPLVAMGNGARAWIRVWAGPYPKRGSTRKCMATCPSMPSTRRTSSRSGPRTRPGSVITSVTRTRPVTVVNVVSRTLVSGRYRRWACAASSGPRSQVPPRSASRTRAKTLGESRFERHHQSTDPSLDTSAAVRPSPMTA